MAARQHCVFFSLVVFSVSSPFYCFSVSNKPFFDSTISIRYVCWFFALTKLQNGIFTVLDSSLMCLCFYSILSIDFFYHFEEKEEKIRIQNLNTMLVYQSRWTKKNIVCDNRKVDFFSWSSWPLFSMYLNWLCHSLFFFHSLLVWKRVLQNSKQFK